MPKPSMVLSLIVLGRPAGAAYVATSLRKRLTRAGHLMAMV